MINKGSLLGINEVLELVSNFLVMFSYLCKFLIFY